MTNLLQSATFPGITHKFLDLFASSKKNALFACVDLTLFHLYIYRWVQVTPFLHRRFIRDLTAKKVSLNAIGFCFIHN